MSESHVINFVGAHRGRERRYDVLRTDAADNVELGPRFWWRRFYFLPRQAIEEGIEDGDTAA
jgi:hypothetical protein